MSRAGPIVLWLALATPLLAAGPCLAQSRMDQATAAAAEEAAASTLPRHDDMDGTAMPAAPSAVVLGDAATRQWYLDSMQRYYEYRANGYAYRSRVFEWQLLSSRMIFVVVLALVAAGMYFAAVQFRLAMKVAARRADAAPSAAAADPGLSLATQLEVSAKGVVVNSSVLGVIILSLSLAFFYLYLIYVYPIQNVF